MLKIFLISSIPLAPLIFFLILIPIANRIDGAEEIFREESLKKFQQGIPLEFRYRPISLIYQSLPFVACGIMAGAVVVSQVFEKHLVFEGSTIGFSTLAAICFLYTVSLYRLISYPYPAVILTQDGVQYRNFFIPWSEIEDVIIAAAGKGLFFHMGILGLKLKKMSVPKIRFLNFRYLSGRYLQFISTSIAHRSSLIFILKHKVGVD